MSVQKCFKFGGNNWLSFIGRENNMHPDFCKCVAHEKKNFPKNIELIETIEMVSDFFLTIFPTTLVVGCKVVGSLHRFHRRIFHHKFFGLGNHLGRTDEKRCSLMQRCSLDVEYPPETIGRLSPCLLNDESKRIAFV